MACLLAKIGKRWTIKKTGSTTGQAWGIA